jgi:hypothetical protein
MLLLIDIFSINKGRGYENPSLEIIVTEHCSTGGCPLEEAHEHCFLNQSVISVVVLISFLCYCGDYAGYITVILPFLAFYFCSAYFLYLVYYSVFRSVPGPLDLYKPYGSIPELFDFSIQDAHQMHLESAFLLHLNNIPINNMISIRYVFL